MSREEWRLGPGEKKLEIKPMEPDANLSPGNTLRKIHPNVIFTLFEVWNITGWKHLGCYGKTWGLRGNNLKKLL